jgi:heptaprenyl diphosphate synthase
MPTGSFIGTPTPCSSVSGDMDVAALLGVPAVAGHLARSEQALRDSVAAMDPFLGEVGGHLIAAGGKRVRPALAMAAASAVRPADASPVTDEVVLGGVACELVHIGSLYHDDVIDEASTRRSVESVNHRWGNLVAILAGDFLLARASEIAAGLGVEVAALLARTIGRLCEGQVGELRTLFDPTRSEADYLASITEKTASLTEAPCRIGAMVSGAGSAEVDAVGAFGLAFGIAFQIRDDVLDVVADEATLGKPAGQDLVEGVYTLPVIRALADPEVGAELRPLLGRPLDVPERDKARDMVRSSSGVAEALAVARRYADAAAAALAGFGGEVASPDGLAGTAHRLLDSLP